MSDDRPEVTEDEFYELIRNYALSNGFPQGQLDQLRLTANDFLRVAEISGLAGQGTVTRGRNTYGADWSWILQAGLPIGSLKFALTFSQNLLRLALAIDDNVLAGAVPFEANREDKYLFVRPAEPQKAIPRDEAVDALAEIIATMLENHDFDQYFE